MLTIQIDENMKSFTRETIFILQIKNFLMQEDLPFYLCYEVLKAISRIINLTNDVVMIREPCKTT